MASKPGKPLKGKPMKKKPGKRAADMQTLVQTLGAGGPPQSLGQAFGP